MGTAFIPGSAAHAPPTSQSEDGHQFTVTCDVQVNLCFIINSSRSIRDSNPPVGRPDNWQLQLEFLAELVDLFTIGPTAIKVGAVIFSEDVRLVFNMDTYTDAQSIKDAILGLGYLGQTTNTPQGLRVTREQCFSQSNGDRPNVLNLAIFISEYHTQLIGEIQLSRKLKH